VAFVDELADAAWAGLRGKPLGGRTPRPAPARQGRLRLELISEAGDVIAEGEAVAELVLAAPVAAAPSPNGKEQS
jgi:hypothetical protein